jgi:X-Pro dipeptidyl-peptidase
MPWRGLVITALALVAWCVPAAGAGITIGPDGRTAPVFDYEQAVRERVYIPQPGIDQDADGVADRIAVEIMRPAGDRDLKVPAIIDASPYYTTVGRGNETEKIGDVDGDGTNDKWPLFYDNFFVPRGYAYVLAQMNGTGNSSGCPLHGGAGDIAGMKSVIDWLNGRTVAYTTLTGSVAATAGWHDGSSAMIGKSYDGTLANGVAATGVAGLKTIVPISAISDWYRYSRMSGVLYSGWSSNYPSSLSNTVTNDDRKALCAPTRTTMNAADGDDTGDMNPFWDERDYLQDVANVKASVFAVHGFQDDNVKLDHLGPWWDGLKAGDVPRKLWLLRGGHVDPFDSRRAVWVDTLHRWFDHWLLGVPNGIMGEPPVTVEESKDVWQDYGDWPLPGSTPVPVYLRGTAPDAAGALGLSSGGALDSLTWIDQGAQTETAIINDPLGPQVRRRVFLSAPLEQDLRISGTPVLDIGAALDKPQSNLGAVLVDYGAGEQTTRGGEGISTHPTDRDCWGASTTREYPPGTVVDHDACYRVVSKPTIAVTQWRITRGILDSANRNSLTSVEPVTPATQTRFSWPLIPDEHVIPKGHQLGVVLVANYSGVGVSGTAGTTFTLDTKVSKVLLPVVGGYRALARTRAFTPEASAPVMSGMPTDVVVDAQSAAGAVVSFALPTATDDETPDPEVKCDPASGTTFPVGATTVTCTATDAYGNASKHAFTVTVVGKGSPPPVNDQPTPPSPTLDGTAPVLAKLGITPLRRGLRLRYTLSEDAKLKITVKHKGAKRSIVRTVVGRAGKRSVKLMLGKLTRGRYTVRIVATDSAGNTAAKTLRFRRR